MHSAQKTQGGVRRTRDHRVCDNILSLFKVFGPWKPDQLFSEHKRKSKYRKSFNLVMYVLDIFNYFKVQRDEKACLQ